MGYADALPDFEDSPGSTFTFSMTNPALSRRETPLLFQDVLSICGLAPLKDLRVDTESYKVSLSDWRPALAPFAQLRKLDTRVWEGPGDPHCPVISCLNLELGPTGTIGRTSTSSSAKCCTPNVSVRPWRSWCTNTSRRKWRCAPVLYFVRSYGDVFYDRKEVLVTIVRFSIVIR